MKKLIKKLQQTALGGFLKVFLFAMIVFAGDNYIKGTLDLNVHFLHAAIKAGFIAVLPTIYNWFNPNYVAYGKQPKIQPLKPDPKN
jgi:hypothetical protein